jgi:hypothetical protein
MWITDRIIIRTIHIAAITAGRTIDHTEYFAVYYIQIPVTDKSKVHRRADDLPGLSERDVVLVGRVTS